MRYGLQLTAAHHEAGVRAFIERHGLAGRAIYFRPGRSAARSALGALVTKHPARSARAVKSSLQRGPRLPAQAASPTFNGSPATAKRYQAGVEMAELMGVDRFQRLFRETASLDADKTDVRYMNDLVNRKLHSLLVAAQGAARVDGRDVIEAGDFPVTAGLQECLQAFERLERLQECLQAFEALETEVELESILQQLADLPPLQLAYGEDMRARLPLIAGAVAVAIARTLKALKPDMEKPEPAQWDRVEEILKIVL
jgi:uncharacterized protein YerC